MNKSSFCDGWIFWNRQDQKRMVILPHDAMQERGRNKSAPSGRSEGFYLGGSYTYEKTFYAPEEWKNQDILVEFEGVMPNAQVLLNGKPAGSCSYGYSGFFVSLHDPVYGQKNTLTVLVENENHPSSRWYAGGGIYRPVWLWSAGKTHFLPDGIHVETVSCGGENDAAKIRITADYTAGSQSGTDPSKESFSVHVQILDDRMHVVSESRAEARESRFRMEMDVPEARLWDAEEPNLYTCRLMLNRGNDILDEQSVIFGIRTLKWSPLGFQVNGKSMKLKGGCIHHDNGILGARSFDESEWRRIRKLKEMGFNAIRSAHNPLCRAALEACDTLGMYVMDEAWDTWNYTKMPYDHGTVFMETWKTDLARMTAKDYNHPCVVMYSVGNELTEPAKAEGLELAKLVIAQLKSLDPTRPVTAGINLTLMLMAAMENHPLDDGLNKMSSEQTDSTEFNRMVFEFGKKMLMAAATQRADEVSSPILDLLDICGYNYAATRYDTEGTIHPERVIVGSETYTYDLASTWKQVERYPYLIGDFMWTAWDYLGEVGIGGWSYEENGNFEKGYPWLLADCGALDILGNDNAAAGMASVVWGARETPYIGVCPVNHPGADLSKAMWRGTNAIPSWSWKGCEGYEAEIEIYSKEEEVELFLNGRSLGRQKPVDTKAVFRTLYEPGELRCAAYGAEGHFLNESSLRSADENTMIRIRPENKHYPDDIVYVDISLTGENGEVESNGDTDLTVMVEGGQLLAFGSARPKTEEDFLSGHYKTYYGRSQAIIRKTQDTAIVRVTGEGLADAECPLYL